MEVKSAIGVFENAVFDEILCLVAVHEIDRVPVSGFHDLLCRPENNGGLPGPLGHHDPLDQDSVLSDAVTIGVLSGELYDSAWSNEESAPLRDPEIAVDSDTATPD